MCGGDRSLAAQLVRLRFEFYLDAVLEVEPVQFAEDLVSLRQDALALLARHVLIELHVAREGNL